MIYVYHHNTHIYHHNTHISTASAGCPSPIHAVVAAAGLNVALTPTAAVAAAGLNAALAPVAFISTAVLAVLP